jgi:DNA modification methylase
MVDGKYAEPMDVLGGASRFFYCPKASKKDRNEALEHLPISRPDTRTETGMGSFVDKGVQPQQNNHPTVKPTELMTYLIRLVTPKGGIVLDPFMGSGSTGKAAMREEFQFVGIEREKDYFQIAEARIQYEIDNPYIEGKDERIQLNKTAKNFW